MGANGNSLNMKKQVRFQFLVEKKDRDLAMDYAYRNNTTLSMMIRDFIADIARDERDQRKQR